MWVSGCTPVADVKPVSIGPPPGRSCSSETGCCQDIFESNGELTHPAEFGSGTYAVSVLTARSAGASR